MNAPSAAPGSYEARINRILSDLTAIPGDKIRGEDRLREDLGLDSVSRMELVSMLAEEFDMDIELEEAVAVEDVGSIYALAHSRLDHA